MNRVEGRSWPQSAMYALAGGVVTALLTLLCYKLGLGLAVAAPVYLLIVVLQSLTGDIRSSGLISILAAACLDYFFVEPRFSFRVMQPSDVFALASFLITALVITELVSRLRAEVRVSTTQKERLDRLYQLSQRLLSLEPEVAGEEFLEPFHSLFGVNAISIFDGQTGESKLLGGSRHQLAEKTRDAYIGGRDAHDRAAGIAVSALRVGSKVTGAIGFEGLHDPEGTLAPLAALMSAHFEKTRAFRAASSA